jgi:hypothetical protein
MLNLVGALLVSILWGVISTHLVMQALLVVVGIVFALIGLAAGRMRKADSFLMLGVGLVSIALFLGLLYAGHWARANWFSFGVANVEAPAYWLAAAASAFGSLPQLPPKLRKSWRNSTIPGSLEEDTRTRRLGVAPVQSGPVLAPRTVGGGVGHYRVYADFQPPLLVDSDRAYNASQLLGNHAKAYFWAYRMFWLLTAMTFFGGFLSLIWLPWWTPIGGLFLSGVIYRAARECCADFVHDIVAANPEVAEEFRAVGLIRWDIPPAAIPA